MQGRKKRCLGCANSPIKWELVGGILFERDTSKITVKGVANICRIGENLVSIGAFLRNTSLSTFTNILLILRQVFFILFLHIKN